MNTLLKGKYFSLLVCLLLTTLCASAARNIAPRATVDRTVVSEGDSLTLTIRIDDTGSYDAPDYSPLQGDFELYGTSQSTQHAINNGRIQSQTVWQTTLLPKRSGQLQIPPLAVAGSQTQPITIQVNPASATAAVDSSEPVFIEVNIDRDNVYVQQQILLTARVYVAVQLDNMQLSKPDFDNANVKQLGEHTFNRTVSGIAYEVHELTYAIFPQQAGDLTIPELVFSAVEVTRSRSLFDFPGRGRPLRKMSKQLTVHVKPIPKNYSGSVWLPARNLTLTETWSGEPHRLAVGDSITRSIAIRADGLLAAQLPKLDEPQLDAAKIYSDQPKLDEMQDGSGVHGKRTENTALIPTRAGQLQLPETRVVWWDIDSDSEKVATLPAQTLTIASGNGQSTTPSQPAALPAPDRAVPESLPEPAKSAEALASPSDKTLLGWQLATAILALLWLVTLFAYWRFRQRVLSHRERIDTNRADIDEQNAWKDFSAACHANDPATTRQTLLVWANQFYPTQNIRSVEQLQRAIDDPRLVRELQLLDNRLFGARHDSGEWNGENLLRVIQDIRKRKPRETTASDALPPLYATPSYASHTRRYR